MFLNTMPTFKAQVSVLADTALPRDRFVNVIHFDRPVALPADPDAIARDIALVFDNWYSAPDREIRVKLYQTGTPGPHFPFGEGVRNASLAPASDIPREVAMCLSFYAGRNLPRQRGRIYLPLVGSGYGTSLRPPLALREKALDLAAGLAGIGGADIDWGVWSPTDNKFRAVSNAWVDDEWDTQRSRGLRATTRSMRAVGA